MKNNKTKKRPFGYVKFSLVGTECEKFLSEAISEGIEFSDPTRRISLFSKA